MFAFVRVSETGTSRSLLMDNKLSEYRGKKRNMLTVLMFKI